MREDPNHFRNCKGCGRYYNAFQKSNYFYCSYNCSMKRYYELNPVKEEDYDYWGKT